jgi:HlyD family secretion protein
MRDPAVDRLLTAVRPSVLAGLFVTAFAGEVASDPAAGMPEAPAVVAIVARASTACFSAAIQVDGVIMPRREALVSPEQESRVTEVLADEGDWVTAGQELVQLKLSATPGVSGAGGGAIQTLRAPAAGVVVSRTAVVGANASPRPRPPSTQPQPLFRIAVGGEVEFVADVPSFHLWQLEVGQTTRVTLDDGRDLNGRVSGVPASVEPQSQMAHVRVSVDGDRLVRVGTFAHATIDASRSCGVAVPRSALLYRTAGTTVQVVHDGKVETRRVSVGLVSDRDAEIWEGVHENELIVAHAGTSLRDGDRVKPIFVDEASRMGAR